MIPITSTLHQNTECDFYPSLSQQNGKLIFWPFLNRSESYIEDSDEGHLPLKKELRRSMPWVMFAEVMAYVVGLKLGRPNIHPLFCFPIPLLLC